MWADSGQAPVGAEGDPDEAGFTLIELLVTVVIIGILAAIAIPVFLAQRDKARDAAATSDLRSAAQAEDAYLIDTFPVTYTTQVSGSGGLENNGYKASAGVDLRVAIDGGNGYCLVAKSASGHYLVYDSGAGGLVAGYQGSFPSSWPTGGSCAVNHPTAF